MSDEPPPTVVLSANSCWNLLHFRDALITGLQDAGYRIAAFAPADGHADALRRRGVEVHDTPVARGGMNPLADALLFLRYLSALRRTRPAAYCGFTIKPNVYGAAAARMAGVPVINNVTGLGTAFLARGPMWRLTGRLYRWAFQRSHRVFFHNGEDLHIFVRERIIRSGQGAVIPGSGINLREFKPDSRQADGPAKLLFIGRAIRDKGISEYVEAARRLRPRMPEVRFQVLGNPDRGNPTSVSAAQFQEWIGQGLIEHLGEHRDVRPFIRDAAAIVLPSYREGMSRALLEAAAMGKPLIGTDVAGCRELVEEGVTGARCKPRDAASLADAMERIVCSSPERLQALGRAARTKVEREFGERIVVEAYLQALAECCGALMSLRVVHVIGGLGLGGAETLLYRVASHPLPGVEQHVICLGKPDWYSSRLTEKGVEVHHLGMDSPLTALGRIRRLGAVLRRMRPDVIQSWMYLSNLLSSLVARRCRTPVVWGIHNSSLERVGLASRLCVYAGGRGARRLASFVVNCSSHSAELHAELGYSAGANAVIANGYDPSVFGPEPHARAFTRCNLGLGDETFVVGSIARWHPDKDIPTLLRAARIAADEGVPLRCLLVGRGLGPDDQELATAIRAVGCQDVMAALGERSDIPNLARAFDLHVLSSRSEAFPNVIAETMLSGTPNVATDAGDSAAIIGDEGWVVPPASPRRLADAIVEAYEEWSRRPADWSGRGEACRQRIVDNYAFEKMANAYADVWRRVATKSA